MKEVLTYCDKNGNSPVLEFLRKADNKIRLKLRYQVRLMQTNKQLLCEPHVKHFTIERYKMFYEFRIKAVRKIVRIIFCECDNNIILLHAFYKKDKKDTEHALDYTLKLLESLERDGLMTRGHLCEVNIN